MNLTHICNSEKLVGFQRTKIKQTLKQIQYNNKDLDIKLYLCILRNKFIHSKFSRKKEAQQTKIKSNLTNSTLI